MKAARQACRPKHQVLVLKCYPKYSKTQTEVRANSSELSYLLYYASTRRSKLAKVTDFLDKRATSDVWKGRTGNVSVTLQIVTALIEKTGRDLGLYARAVLHILKTILDKGHVDMCEDTVACWDALCRHQEPAALAADREYARLYDEIVALYAAFAANDHTAPARQTHSPPVQLRFRNLALHALRAVAQSESLASETGRQLNVIIPVILANLHADTAHHLTRLESRERDDEAHDKELALARRKSVSAPATATTNDQDEPADPAAASGTAEDADKLAEDKVGVLALQALRSIFQAANRGQLRLATAAVLGFITAHPAQSWPTELMALVCAWAPVQNRYAILVALVETLVRSPMVEEHVHSQLLLATMLDSLLSSPINFIGLSVMDVLLALISHTLLLLQLGGPGSSFTPPTSEKEVVTQPSQARVQLLHTLRSSMAHLATHVYYTDQISDMVEALLSRLKPSPASTTTAKAIENPQDALDAVATSGSLREKTHVDQFFSFETARITALEAVKAIIQTANARRPDGSSAVARSTIGVSVWEGTQWLLRDPSGVVRKAYVDALVTWLSLEQTRHLHVSDTKHRHHDSAGLVKRAVSSASQREKSPRPGTHSFLPLLHLAVYENALHFVDSEADYLLLHLLLTTLVERLGVNAARTGLPMILRLQEDIASVAQPAAKVRIGSLVHGYLWALSITFDFETSAVGRAVHSEISRRNNHALWLNDIRLPPTPLDRIDTPHPSLSQLPPSTVQSESLIPFDNRDALVDMISEGYSASLHSPPSSPPASPGRSMSASYSLPVIRPPTIETNNILSAPTIPFAIRQDLLADWTREQCFAANTKRSSSASISGSRSGTQYNGSRNYLGVRVPNGEPDSSANSPSQSPRRAHSRPTSLAYGLVGRLSSPQRRRSPSENRSNDQTTGHDSPRSRSSLRSTVRVHHLKRALSGSGPLRTYSMRSPSRREEDEAEGEDTDSLVTTHSLSDASFTTTHDALARDRHAAMAPAHEDPATPAATLTPRPLAAPDAPQYFTTLAGDLVPPVPALPADLVTHAAERDSSHVDFNAPSARSNGAPQVQAQGLLHKSRSVKSGVSRGRSGKRQQSASEAAVLDVDSLLGSVGLDGDDEDISVSGEGLGSAPY